MGRVAVSIVVTLLVAACGALPGPSAAPPTPHAGGTARIGIGRDVDQMRSVVFADPSDDFPTGFMAACCLARAPLAYPGRSTAEGGIVLLPDLAEQLPTVSSDGRTWTFHLQRGIRYAPPYEATEVVAPDIIRAVERNARRSPFLTEPHFGAPYGYVAGAAAFAAGEAPTISGLTSPDPHTLVVRLTTAFRGFGHLATGFGWSPIPETVAAEHDEEIGRYWASSGPYMVESFPGTATAGRIVLVRNPSWDRATDRRRGAWVDRIEITPAGEVGPAHDAVEAGDLDLVDWVVPADRIERYRNDPALSMRLRTTTSESIWWVPMNLAVPPFDDVAVRRAVNAVVDRAGLRDAILAARERATGPQPPGRVSQHVFPDSITGGLLLTYAPWASPGDHGDRARAGVEMASSRYDTDADGRCDAAACRGVRLAAQDLAAGELLARDLASIGIEAEVVEATESTDSAFVRNRTPIQVNTFGWGYDLTGEDLASLLRGSLIEADEPTLNASLVGATTAQLAEWGYEVESVPGVDDIVDRCTAEAGHLRARCWAELDQYVTEVLVPWIPLFSFEIARLSSARVSSFSIDQSAPFGFPALDGLVLEPGADG